MGTVNVLCLKRILSVRTWLQSETVTMTYSVRKWLQAADSQLRFVKITSSRKVLDVEIMEPVKICDNDAIIHDLIIRMQIVCKQLMSCVKTAS